MRTRSFLAAGSTFAGVAVVWLTGSALSAPANRPIGPPPPSLGAREVELANASGGRIYGWFVAASEHRGGVVLAHSVRSNRLEMVERAQFLERAGYSSLLYDAQAHGESPGDAITFGFRESADARAAVSFLQAELPNERIAFLGVSMGGASALLGPDPLEIDALILEAVYPTLREAVVNRISIRLGPLGKPLAPLLLCQLEPRLGISPDSVAPIDGIREIRAPLLLIAGENDRHTTLAQSRRLFEAAPEPKTLWIVPGATHVNFHRFATSDYEKRVLEFLQSTIGRH